MDATTPRRSRRASRYAIPAGWWRSWGFLLVVWWLTLGIIPSASVALAGGAMFPNLLQRWPRNLPDPANPLSGGNPRAIMSHDEFEGTGTRIALVDDVVMVDDPKQTFPDLISRLYRWHGNFDTFTILARLRKAEALKLPSRIFNNLVMRGIASPIVLSTALLFGFAAVTVPGVQEIRYVVLAEQLFALIMIALLHDKFTGPSAVHLK